jgi:hypothetical protein
MKSYCPMQLSNHSRHRRFAGFAFVDKHIFEAFQTQEDSLIKFEEY